MWIIWIFRCVLVRSWIICLVRVIWLWSLIFIILSIGISLGGLCLSDFWVIILRFLVVIFGFCFLVLVEDYVEVLLLLCCFWWLFWVGWCNLWGNCCCLVWRKLMWLRKEVSLVGILLFVLLWFVNWLCNVIIKYFFVICDCIFVFIFLDWLFGFGDCKGLYW